MKLPPKPNQAAFEALQEALTPEVIREILDQTPPEVIDQFIENSADESVELGTQDYVLEVLPADNPLVLAIKRRLGG